MYTLNLDKIQAKSLIVEIYNLIGELKKDGYPYSSMWWANSLKLADDLKAHYSIEFCTMCNVLCDTAALNKELICYGCRH